MEQARGSFSTGMRAFSAHLPLMDKNNSGSISKLSPPVVWLMLLPTPYLLI